MICVNLIQRRLQVWHCHSIFCGTWNTRAIKRCQLNIWLLISVSFRVVRTLILSCILHIISFDVVLRTSCPEICIVFWLITVQKLHVIICLQWGLSITEVTLIICYIDTLWIVVFLLWLINFFKSIRTLTSIEVFLIHIAILFNPRLVRVCWLWITITKRILSLSDAVISLGIIFKDKISIF